MKRVIIDTDPGIDDAAAILLALASPELSVEAVTTVYGNGTIEECTRNVLIILETAGRGDILVHRGVGKPLMRELGVSHMRSTARTPWVASGCPIPKANLRTPMRYLS